MAKKPAFREPVAALGFRTVDKWITCHLGGAYGPELSRVRRSLVEGDDKLESSFFSFNLLLMIKSNKAIKAKKKSAKK